MTAIQLPKDRLISMAELTGATAAMVQPDANVYAVLDPQLPYAKGSHSFQKAVMGMHRVALVNAIEAGTVTARSLSTRVPFCGDGRIDSDWERTSNAYGVTHADALKFCELLAIDVRTAGPASAPEPLKEAAHAVAPATATTTRISRRSKRSDLLTPVIEAAQRECGGLADANSIWPVLIRNADERKGPLIGVSDEGIKWRNDQDDVKFFTLKNLRDRLNRARD